MAFNRKDDFKVFDQKVWLASPTMHGEELDYVKASGLLFDDFRGGKIGRVTLEWPEQEKSE